MSGNHVALVSGGMDSTVAAHVAVRWGPADLLVYLDTGTGLDDNREYVEQLADTLGVQLWTLRTKVSYEDRVDEHGLPRSVETLGDVSKPQGATDRTTGYHVVGAWQQVRSTPIHGSPTAGIRAPDGERHRGTGRAALDVARSDTRLVESRVSGVRRPVRSTT